ncbi:efflux RND transporter periplasmic adaptor subunit [Pedobacter antarcticus]|uniref:RND transporter n=2 Tax=Pedobacter antarcticus TaxID=34086 RepID=A0A081PJL3_9SPHI|nr:efflux RND transporter periplasmic adaptor subunit [Pedobacter antarcticus]KEQ30886.1 RND transporter [Pedobacter antarcticus 4BY]SDL74729.1 membrane fusion protein, multidrug efflux system [Pedobacter antarcticus]SFF24895.1 membrane fusion protein, multidrug efflux system [Pedobacter antarcticus]
MKSSILLIALFIAGCSGNQQNNAPAPAQAFPVITLNESDETTYVEYPASVQGVSDIDIRPQVSGILDKIYVAEGARVTKGQPLFQISPLPFREALNTAKATYQAAEAALVSAKLEVEKLKPLVSNQVVSDFQLKTAMAAEQLAKANTEQARAGVEAAKINLGYTTIAAPVSGFIGRLPKKQGSLVGVSDAMALTTISDAHEVYAYFSLGEDDYIDFNSKYQGKDAAERFKNMPKVSLILADKSAYTSQGRIDMVDGQFNRQTGSITLRATFPNEAGVLKSGNTGRIRLGKKHGYTVMVPQASTVEVQDKLFVFTVDAKNQVSKQPIQIIGASGTNYLVQSGLKKGDRIVFDGIDKLKEGDHIQPEQVSKDKQTALN